MNIQVNGETQQCTCRTLAELLATLDYKSDAVATAVNGTFVPATNRDSCELAENDAVEIIAPMSGG